MPLTHQRTTKPTTRGRKGNLRNGAVLALSQAAKLVNIPLAHDVARHVKETMVALKPSVLQAPKANDSSAKHLEDHVAGLLNALDTALPMIDQNEELDRLCDLLRDAHAELVRIRTSHYTEKLASQAQIRDRIIQLKEDMAGAIVDITLRLLLITLAGSMRERQRTRRAIMRANKAAVQTRRTVARHQSALVQKDNLTGGFTIDIVGYANQDYTTRGNAAGTGHYRLLAMIPTLASFSLVPVVFASPARRCMGTISSLDDVSSAVECTTININSSIVPAGETFSISAPAGATVNVLRNVTIDTSITPSRTSHPNKPLPPHPKNVTNVQAISKLEAYNQACQAEDNARSELISAYNSQQAQVVAALGTTAEKEPKEIELDEQWREGMQLVKEVLHTVKEGVGDGAEADDEMSDGEHEIVDAIGSLEPLVHDAYESAYRMDEFCTKAYVHLDHVFETLAGTSRQRTAPQSGLVPRDETGRMLGVGSGASVDTMDLLRA
ncbi:hypothetical protein RSOLAG22IIIB_10032 [Rhizoctonia solani]|uniref:Uncharacterized protein n=1 Tax=Rhizoctonia solani TaxID=456999 RepID=A0A0K6G0K3_9AGAM|nr:hypothetical protein RSOLAG22IIIB_10032 [Rhizoctonia solani]